MQWYLDRQLATTLSSTSIKLTFETKGKGHQDDPYYLEDRENRCVVCGVFAGSRVCTGLMQYHVGKSLSPRPQGQII